MTEILKVPFNRSYWVVPGKLLAGCYPGSEDPIGRVFGDVFGDILNYNFPAALQ
jgi:hypothetical protein